LATVVSAARTHIQPYAVAVAELYAAATPQVFNPFHYSSRSERGKGSLFLKFFVQKGDSLFRLHNSSLCKGEKGSLFLNFLFGKKTLFRLHCSSPAESGKGSLF